MSSQNMNRFDFILDKKNAMVLVLATFIGGFISSLVKSGTEANYAATYSG